MRLGAVGLALLLIGGCAGTSPQVTNTPTPAPPIAVNVVPSVECPSPQVVYVYPSPVASATAGLIANVQGLVYDTAGRFVHAGHVRMESLSQASPYLATVSIELGMYRHDRLPPGVPIRFTIVVDGRDAMEREVTLLPRRSMVSFGGPATEFDAEAPKYAVPVEALPSPVSSGGAR